MAFPDTPLPIKNELLINGVWTDITSYTRGPDQSGVSITRGSSGEQTTLSAGTANFVLNNRDGRFSNRNPMSPYYGLLGFNVQNRISIQAPLKYLRLTDTSVTSTARYDGARAETADKAVLDITGDIDLRADVEPDHWLGRPGQLLITKYATVGNNRSWAFYSDERGLLQFTWTSDGTGGTIRNVESTVPLPSFRGRLAVRVTVDVDNGAGGHTITFYTSNTINGTWTALGATVNAGAFTTSFYNGSANLEIGTVSAGSGRVGVFGGGGLGAADPFCGKYYAAEVRSGINGTVVARMDATAQAVGALSWSDGLATPNTWNLIASAEISQSDYRFWGEIPKLSLRSDPTATDVFAPVQTSDYLQRFIGKNKPIRSAIYRNLRRYTVSGSAYGYWPMDNQASGTTAGFVVGADVGDQGYMNKADFGAADGLPGSGGALTFNDDDGYASGKRPEIKPGTTTLYPSGTTDCIFYFRMNATPPSATYVLVHTWYHRFSDIDSVAVYANNVGFQLVVVDTVGATKLSTTSLYTAAGGAPTIWRAMRISIVQNGGGADWNWNWYTPLGEVVYGLSGTMATTVVGSIISWISWPFVGKFGYQLAHVWMGSEVIAFNDYAFIASTNGYIGEPASDRWDRLCKEELIKNYIIGTRLVSGVHLDYASMGAQRPLPIVSLLQEVVDADGGIAYAARDKFGLTFRMLNSITNAAGPELSYSGGYFNGDLLPEEPNQVRNDITVDSVSTGITSRVQKLSGDLNVNEPETDPTGAGRIEAQISRNVIDQQLQQVGYRELLYGTWYELRFPRAMLWLQRRQYTTDAALTASMRALDLGDPYTITDLPTWISYEKLGQSIRGYTELLENQRHELSHNLVPSGQYTTGIWGPYAGPIPATRWQAYDITTAASYAAGVTTIVVRSVNYNNVTFSNTSNYDLVIAGERIGILAGNVGGRTSSGGFWQQTITNVVRAKNGVAKTLPAASPVKVWQGGRYAG